MIHQLEAEFSGDFFLHLFNLFAPEFDDIARAQID